MLNEAFSSCEMQDSAAMAAVYQTYLDAIRKEIVLGKDTIDTFRCFESESIMNALLQSTFLNLKWNELKNSAMKIPQSSRLRLSVPPGCPVYVDILLKRLANHYNTKLLIFDINAILQGSPRKCLKLRKEAIRSTTKYVSFKTGDRVMYVGSSQNSRGPCYGYTGTLFLTSKRSGIPKIGVRFDEPISEGFNLNGLCEEDHGFFCSESDLLLESSAHGEMDKLRKKLIIGAVFEVVKNESENGPIILFMNDIEWTVRNNSNFYTLFKKKLDSLVGCVVVMMPFFNIKTNTKDKILDLLYNLFPNTVTMKIPQFDSLCVDCKRKFKKDMKIVTAKHNVPYLKSAFSRYGVKCDGIDKICIKNQLLSNASAEKICLWVLNHHQIKDAVCSTISTESVHYALSKLHGISCKQQKDQSKPDKIKSNLDECRQKFQEVECKKEKIENKSKIDPNNSDILKKSLKDIVTENEFEKSIINLVISSNNIGVTFEDIGALENVKETLQELVMLPLQRPNLFRKGQLIKPCKGILLFGPPGTGKTMLAKAIACEAGANFINISVSTVTSKVVGESEKYIKAVFSVASKISPCVIFIDEVDNMLAVRDMKESAVMRRMKNEFMVNWDGLCSKEKDRVLVLASTNRPFDLDEAALRRFSKRLLVDLPDAEYRAKILKTILAKEILAPDMDIDVIVNMTRRYSGSDLKDLCDRAAYIPIREFLEKENKEQAIAIKEGRAFPSQSGSDAVRPLNTDDLRQACEQVSASVSLDSTYMKELLQWSDEYGGGGRTKLKKQMSYFM